MECHTKILPLFIPVPMNPKVIVGRKLLFVCGPVAKIKVFWRVAAQLRVAGFTVYVIYSSSCNIFVITSKY